VTIVTSPIVAIVVVSRFPPMGSFAMERSFVRKFVCKSCFSSVQVIEA
jgi:hypothetical protein